MRTELVTFTASVLINAGFLFSLDHAALRYDQAVLARQQRPMVKAQQGSDAIHFEFVEAPPVAPTRPPKKTRKIAAHDSLAQDLTLDKSKTGAAPQIKSAGVADQLAQKKADTSTPPVAKATPEIVAKPAVQAVPAEAQPAQPAVSASQPSPVTQAVPGRDRITTSELSKSRSHGAQLYGVTSFEATGSGMGRYIKNMKERIWLAWFPYLAAHYPKDFKTADALLTFTLDAKGQVRTVKVAESKGSPLFSAFCMEAVQRASPFGPVPQEILDLMGKDEIEIKFAFHYW